MLGEGRSLRANVFPLFFLWIWVVYGRVAWWEKNHTMANFWEVRWDSGPLEFWGFMESRYCRNCGGSEIFLTSQLSEETPKSVRPNWITKLLTLGSTVLGQCFGWQESTPKFVLTAKHHLHLTGSSFHYTMSKFHACQVEGLECEQLMSAEH